jgi:hypothetical protein
MAIPAYTLSTESEQSILDYYKKLATLLGRTQSSYRNRLESLDRNYLREVEASKEHNKAVRANRAGDQSKFQNVTIPIIKPQIEAQVGYQTSVFLTDYPIFGVSADPYNQDKAKQLQAVIEENSISAGWVKELMLFFHDGARYNDSLVEVSWEKRTVPSLVTDLSYSVSEGKPTTDTIWQGNVLNRWDMYNSFVDTRCLAEDLPEEGEFAGTVRIISKTALKTLFHSLPNKIIKNAKEAYESATTVTGNGVGANGIGYYTPSLRVTESTVERKDEEDWNAWAGLAQSNDGKISYKGVYELTKLYLRILPAEHKINVPAKNTPQVWLFYIVNHSVIISAERMTNAHNKIPVLRGRPAEDGLGDNSKSLTEDALPFQSIASALANSIIHARRRAVFDRFIYDPSRVNEGDINNPNPAARIRVRPNAFGKPISEAVHQIPFRDDQASDNMQTIQLFIGLADKLNGNNPARQGQFVQGNKTNEQWSSVMSNATSKDLRMALVYEATVFSPMKEIIKLNILQFQGAGTVYSPSAKEEVQIDPLELRKANLTFKVTDGMLPKDKVMSTQARQTAMQVIGTSPSLAGAYNIGQLFSFIMKEENVDLSPFEKSPEQLAYEQAVAQWSQLAQLAIQKQAAFNVPQPTPEQFGYVPANQNPNKAGGPNQSAQQ